MSFRLGLDAQCSESLGQACADHSPLGPLTASW